MTLLLMMTSENLRRWTLAWRTSDGFQVLRVLGWKIRRAVSLFTTASARLLRRRRRSRRRRQVEGGRRGCLAEPSALSSMVSREATHAKYERLMPSSPPVAAAESRSAPRPSWSHRSDKAGSVAKMQRHRHRLSSVLLRLRPRRPAVIKIKKPRDPWLPDPRHRWPQGWC